MKINFNQELKEYTGEAFLIENKPVTLGYLCEFALKIDNPQSPKDPNKKLPHYLLAKRIHQGQSDEIDISAEEIAEIKDCVKKNLTTVAAAICLEALEA